MSRPTSESTEAAIIYRLRALHEHLTSAVANKAGDSGLSVRDWLLIYRSYQRNPMRVIAPETTQEAA